MEVQSRSSLLFILICFLLLLSGCGSDDALAAEIITNESVPVAAPITTSPTVADTPTHAAHEQPVESTPVESTPAQSSGKTSRDTVTIDIDMHDTYYGAQDSNMVEPPVWTAPSGANIILNLINHGAENHNWAIVKNGVEVPIPYEEGRESEILLVEPGMIYANSQTQWVIRSPEPGEYEVICTVSGHYPFMRGKLIITQ